MMELIKNLIQSNLLKSLIALVIGIIIYNFLKRVINKNINVKNLNSRQETYFKLINNVFRYVFFIVLILFILQINGVNVSSLITGVGIVSAILGLALQDLLKDIIMGINILSENFFMVGDIVKYEDIEGKVLSIGLRNTKIKDIYTDHIFYITNRNIDRIQNVSGSIYVSVPAPYEEPLEKIEGILEEVCNQMKQVQYVSDCKYIGVGAFESSSMIYKLKVVCEPEFKPSIYRKVLRCVKVLFDENGVEIPYQQIDIHTK